MMRVDKEGVPRTVQHIRFYPESYLFKIRLFTGEKFSIEPEFLLRDPPDIFGMDWYAEEHLMDAYIAADKLYEKN